MSGNGQEDLIYAVVMDASGRKLVGKVQKGALERWLSGSSTTRGVLLHQPIQMQDKAVQQGENIRMEVHTYPLDSMDVGITSYALVPSGYYYPVGHRLQALHESRWMELSAKASGLALPA